MPIQISGAQMGVLSGGPSAINLSNLGDVDINSPVTGQYLRYDSSSDTWDNAYIDAEVYGYLDSNMSGSNGVSMTYTPGTETIGISLNLTATGDVTGSVSSGSLGLTLATVNANVGTFGSAATVPVLTVDAKGRITGVVATAIISPSATSLAGGAAGNVVYQSASGTTSFLPAGATSQVLIGGASAPTWSNAPTGLASVTATTFYGDLSGNASTATTASAASTAVFAASSTTATKLATPRAINGVNFDGSAAITVYDSTKFSASGGTISGSTTVSGNISVTGVCTTNSGYTGRAGAGGAASNQFNIYWNGVNASLWIDTTNIGNIQVTSDYRLKKSVKTLTVDSLATVMELRPVTYEFTDYGEMFKADNTPRVGFIAHELQEVIPSAVEGEKDAENQVQSLRLDALCAVLTKAVQELNVKVESLTNELNTLKGKNTD
jgi:hypothetical protein